MTPAQHLYGQIQRGVTKDDEPRVELAEALLAIGEANPGLALLGSVHWIGAKDFAGPKQHRIRFHATRAIRFSYKAFAPRRQS